MGLTILPKVPSTTKQLLTTGPANSWVPRSLPGLVLDLGTMMRDGRGSWLYRALQWIGCLSSDAQLFICGPRRQRHASTAKNPTHSRTAASRLITTRASVANSCLLIHPDQFYFYFYFYFSPKKDPEEGSVAILAKAVSLISSRARPPTALRPECRT
jgi:hypothetical protein